MYQQPSNESVAPSECHSFTIPSSFKPVEKILPLEESLPQAESLPQELIQNSALELLQDPEPENIHRLLRTPSPPKEDSRYRNTAPPSLNPNPTRENKKDDQSNKENEPAMRLTYVDGGLSPEVTFGALYPNLQDRMDFLKRAESSLGPQKTLNVTVGSKIIPIVSSTQKPPSPHPTQTLPPTQPTPSFPSLPATRPDHSPPMPTIPDYTKSIPQISAPESQAITGQPLSISTPKKLDILVQPLKLSHTNIGTTIFDPKISESKSLFRKKNLGGSVDLLGVVGEGEGVGVGGGGDWKEVRNDDMGKDVLMLEEKGVDRTGTGEITFELSGDSEV